MVAGVCQRTMQGFGYRQLCSSDNHLTMEVFIRQFRQTVEEGFPPGLPMRGQFLARPFFAGEFLFPVPPLLFTIRIKQIREPGTTVAGNVTGYNSHRMSAIEARLSQLSLCQ